MLALDPRYIDIVVDVVSSKEMSFRCMKKLKCNNFMWQCQTI